MKMLLATLLAVTFAVSTFAQDKLERPVSTTSTAATINVTFTLGTLGYVQDIAVRSDIVGINTAAVSIVNSTLLFTNTVATLVFTNTVPSRIVSAAWPVEKDDVVRCVMTRSAIATNTVVSVWFKNVIR